MFSVPENCLRSLVFFVHRFPFSLSFASCPLISPYSVSSFLSSLSFFMTKATKWHMRPAKTQISLGVHPVWSESSLSAWRNHGSLATHLVHSEDSDQTELMPRLIWVFAGRTGHFVCFIMLLLIWYSHQCSVNNLLSLFPGGWLLYSCDNNASSLLDA